MSVLCRRLLVSGTNLRLETLDEKVGLGDGCLARTLVHRRISTPA